MRCSHGAPSIEETVIGLPTVVPNGVARNPSVFCYLYEEVAMSQKVRAEKRLGDLCEAKRPCVAAIRKALMNGLGVT